MLANRQPARSRVPPLRGLRALLAVLALGAMLPAATPPLQIHNASRGRWVLQSITDVAGSYTVTYQDRNGACTGVSSFDPAEPTAFTPARRLLIQLLPGESARIDHDGNASLDLRLVDADGRELPPGTEAGDLRFQVTLPAPGDAPHPVGARWRVTNLAALALLQGSPRNLSASRITLFGDRVPAAAAAPEAETLVAMADQETK